MKRRLVSSAVAFLALAWFLPREAAASEPVEWNDDWHRFRIAEAADTLSLGAGLLAVELAWSPPSRPNLTGQNAFDTWVRKELVGRTPAVQGTAATYSDNMMLAMLAAPFVVDDYVVALGIHQSADVAGQMFLIDTQSFAVTGFLSVLAEHAIARPRPYVSFCGADGKVRSASGEVLLNSCSGPADYQSFFSGHSAITATAAGLTCVHHQHIALYGGGVADLAPCLLLIGVSLSTGLSRIAADKHWASDVLTGWGLGTLSGYMLPAVLHYGFGGGRPVGEIHVGDAEMIPVPAMFPGGGGLGMVGTF